MPPESDDPGVVRTVAVAAEDVVTALEYNRRGDADATLRLTPPFHGRMRARIHLDREGSEAGSGDGDESATAPAPVHVAPETLVDDGAVPEYPDPDETADRLRADPDADYSRAAHRERHVAAVEAWREAAADAIVDEAALETPAGTRRVAVRTLG